MKVLLQKLMRSNAWFAILMFFILFLINLAVLPAILDPVNIISTLALIVPLIIAAMAATPPILSGGGGIDVSVGAVMAFINVSMFTILPDFGIQSPIGIMLSLLFLGALIGTISGLLVTVVRLQPIVATLGVSLVLSGLSTYFMPEPTGNAEPWLRAMATYIGPIPAPLIVLAITLLLWWLITKLSYHKALLAVGGDDRSAFSSGLSVTLVRTIAYTIGGFLAALAAITLTACVGAGDPSLGNSYTMVSIAAAALGGTSLMGGRGGMIGSVFGAMAIFFVQKLLSTLGIANFWFMVAYGVILLLALMTNSLIRKSSDKHVRTWCIMAMNWL